MQLTAYRKGAVHSTPKYSTLSTQKVIDEEFSKIRKAIETIKDLIESLGGMNHLANEAEGDASSDGVEEDESEQSEGSSTYNSNVSSDTNEENESDEEDGDTYKENSAGYNRYHSRKRILVPQRPKRHV